MARPFSLRLLAELVINSNFDAPTAAAYFGVTQDFIETQQASSKYRDYLKRITRDNRAKETQLITKIATEVAGETSGTTPTPTPSDSQTYSSRFSGSE